MAKLPVRLLLAASVLLVLAGALWGLLAPPRHCTFQAMKNKHPA